MGNRAEQQKEQMVDTEIASFLNKLEYTLLAEVDSLGEVEDQLWSLHWVLTRLASFPMEVVRRNQICEECFMKLRKKPMEVITLLHELEDVTDSYLDNVKGGKYSSLPDEASKFRSQIKGMTETFKRLHVWFHDQLTKFFTSGTSSSENRPLILEDRHDEVVILEDEVKRMIDLLLFKEDDSRDVIPIVGPGGKGKTTLARKVYDHPTILEHFPCRCWIYVSSHYKVEQLLQDIIKQINPTTTAPAAAAAEEEDERKEKMVSLKDLAIETYMLLKTTSTRYLVVFDDVCTTQFWADIHTLFPNNKCGGGGGSRIIFTTRHDEVALHARSSRPPFNLRLLTKEESWKLFSKRVGLVEDESNRNHHPHPWQEWVDACGGVPHIIVALAEEYIDHRSLPDYHHQLSMADKIPPPRPHQLSMADEIPPPRPPPPPRRIRELIYNDLPHHLKSCLAYIDILGEGSYSVYDFKGLIVAEGLVKPPLPSAAAVVLELEDVAEEYLNELIHRNLIEVKSRSLDGSIKKISLSDLCRSEVLMGNKMKFLQPALGTGFHEFFSSDDVPPPTLKERSLVSWKFHPHSPDGKTVEQIFHDLVSLRVLHLNMGFASIPPEINLIHLRYLLLYTENVNFPECLSDLYNLQFLKIKGCNYCTLQIWKMRQLRHLSCDFVLKLKLNPITRDERFSDDSMILKNLQTLKGLHAGSDGDEEDVLSVTPNLVKLQLRNVDPDGEVTRGVHLLERLRKLKLRDYYHASRGTYQWEIIPPNITHLTLQGTILGWRYMLQTMRKLQNLQVLELKAGSIYETEDLDLGTEGDGDGFRQLKFLKLKDLFRYDRDSIWVRPKKWNLSKGGLPSLQKLTVINCKGLEGLPTAALEGIPTLQELVVDASNAQVLADAILIQKHVGKERLKLEILYPTLDHLLKLARLGGRSRQFIGLN